MIVGVARWAGVLVSVSAGVTAGVGYGVGEAPCIGSAKTFSAEAWWARSAVWDLRSRSHLNTPDKIRSRITMAKMGVARRSGFPFKLLGHAEVTAGSGTELFNADLYSRKHSEQMSRWLRIFSPGSWWAPIRSEKVLAGGHSYRVGFPKSRAKCSFATFTSFSGLSNLRPATPYVPGYLRIRLIRSLFIDLAVA